MAKNLPAFTAPVSNLFSVKGLLTLSPQVWLLPHGVGQVQSWQRKMKAFSDSWHLLLITNSSWPFSTLPDVSSLCCLGICSRFTLKAHPLDLHGYDCCPGDVPCCPARCKMSFKIGSQVTLVALLDGRIHPESSHL